VSIVDLRLLDMDKNFKLVEKNEKKYLKNKL